METKLKLEHLTHYLPYGLKIQITSNQDMGLIGEMKFLKKTYLGVDVGINHTLKLQRCISHIKPILRPLSDLTKEIEHEGESFVPIERLREMFTTRLSFDENGFYYHINKSAVRGRAHDEPFPFNQLDAYSYLLKWKLDIHKLIEKGLAIPVTDEFNPYK
jgi:hypothetical protein